jgi:hypothetical protein
LCQGTGADQDCPTKWLHKISTAAIMHEANVAVKGGTFEFRYYLAVGEFAFRMTFFERHSRNA